MAAPIISDTYGGTGSPAPVNATTVNPAAINPAAPNAASPQANPVNVPQASPSSPDIVQQGISQLPDPIQKIIGSATTGAYNAINTATLGLPDLITKIVSPSEYQATQQVEAAHPVASMVGNVVGAVAPMALGDEAGAIGAGGLAAKGASSAANAIGATKIAGGLDRLVELAKGGEGVSALQQGLAQGMLQSVPTAITQGLTTGDWSQAGKSAALGTALGGVIGGGAGAIAKKMPQAAETIEDQLNKDILSTSGVNTKIIKAVESSGAKLADVNVVGSSLANNQDLMAQVAKTIVDNNLTSEPALRDYALGIGAKYKPFEDAYNNTIASGEGPFWGSRKLSIISDPNIQQQLINLEPEQQSAVLAKLTNGMDKAGTWADTRDYLQQTAMRLRNSEDDVNSATGNIAGLLRKKVSDMGGMLAQAQNPQNDLTPLLRQYPADLVLKMAALHEGQALGTPIKEGSNTFNKFLAQNALSGVVGAGVGGESGGDGFNPVNAAAGFVGGSVLGSLGSRLVTGASNAAAGRAAGVLSKGTPLLNNVAQAIAKNAPAIGTEAARGSAALGTSLFNANQAANQAQTPQALQSQPQAQGQSVSNSNQSKIQQKAVDLIGTDITNPDYQNAVSQGLAREWYAYTKGSPQAGQPTPNNPLYMGWAQGVLGAVKTNGNIDPQKIAPLLFNTKAQAEEYRKYAQSKQSILSVANSVGPNTGYLGSSEPSQLLNPAAAGSRKQVLSEIEKIGGKGARQELDTFLSRTGTNSQALLSKIDELTKKYNPQAQQALRSIGQ